MVTGPATRCALRLMMRGVPPPRMPCTRPTLIRTSRPCRGRSQVQKLLAPVTALASRETHETDRERAERAKEFPFRWAGCFFRRGSWFGAPAGGARRRGHGFRLGRAAPDVDDLVRRSGCGAPGRRGTRVQLGQARARASREPWSRLGLGALAGEDPWSRVPAGDTRSRLPLLLLLAGEGEEDRRRRGAPVRRPPGNGVAATPADLDRVFYRTFGSIAPQAPIPFLPALTARYGTRKLGRWFTLCKSAGEIETAGASDLVFESRQTRRRRRPVVCGLKLRIGWSWRARRARRRSRRAVGRRPGAGLRATSPPRAGSPAADGWRCCVCGRLVAPVPSVGRRGGQM